MSSAKLRIVADANMPQAREIFAGLGTVQLQLGRDISSQTLQQADVLLVRSVTKVTPELLATTPVKFVGTATAGVDHIAEAIRHHGSIGFSDAKGCNANSVVEYVLACLAYNYTATGFDGLAAAIGIVGAGCVGSALARVLSELGAQVYVYDPFVQCEYGQQVRSLAELQQCQVISVHTPFTDSGSHPTQHLLNGSFIGGLASGALLIAAGRGGVVNEAAVLHAIEENKLRYCADVWTNEPVLNLKVLAAATLATPHVAGYSLDGKLKATEHLYRQVCQYFKRNTVLPEASKQGLQTLTANASLNGRAQLYDVVKQAWGLKFDDAALRQAVAVDNSGKAFDALRATMQGRLEFHNYCIEGLDSAAAQLAAIVGFKLP